MPIIGVDSQPGGAGGGGGETNTASNREVNSATSEGVFYQKTLSNLEFKNLREGSNITLTADTFGITIASTAGGGNVVGPGTSVVGNVALFDNLTGTLLSDSGLTLSGSNTGDDAGVESVNGISIAAVVLDTDDIADTAINRYTNDTDITRLLNISGTASGTNTGGNTGDQTSIVGISGTKAQFDTAVSDGNIAYDGDPVSVLVNDAGYLAAISAESIGDLSDVDLTGLAAGQILEYDGANFVLITTPAGGGGGGGTVTDVTATAPVLITGVSTVTPNVTMPAATAVQDGYMRSEIFARLDTTTGVNTGDNSANTLYDGNTLDVTLSGAYSYITIVGQDIVRGQVTLTTDVTGVLPVANGGTGSAVGDTDLANGYTVSETTVTTGTVDYNTFTGVTFTGGRTMALGLVDQQRYPYHATYNDGGVSAEEESGMGMWDSTAGTLSRTDDDVYNSTTSNNRVVWSGAELKVTIVQTSEQMKEDGNLAQIFRTNEEWISFGAIGQSQLSDFGTKAYTPAGQPGYYTNTNIYQVATKVTFTGANEAAVIAGIIFQPDPIDPTATDVQLTEGMWPDLSATWGTIEAIGIGFNCNDEADIAYGFACRLQRITGKKIAFLKVDRPGSSAADYPYGMVYNGHKGTIPTDEQAGLGYRFDEYVGALLAGTGQTALDLMMICIGETDSLTMSSGGFGAQIQDFSEAGIDPNKWGWADEDTRFIASTIPTDPQVDEPNFRGMQAYRDSMRGKAILVDTYGIPLEDDLLHYPAESRDLVSDRMIRALALSGESQLTGTGGSEFSQGGRMSGNLDEFGNPIVGSNSGSSQWGAFYDAISDTDPAAGLGRCNLNLAEDEFRILNEQWGPSLMFGKSQTFLKRFKAGQTITISDLVTTDSITMTLTGPPVRGAGATNYLWRVPVDPATIAKVGVVNSSQVWLDTNLPMYQSADDPAIITGDAVTYDFPSATVFTSGVKLTGPLCGRELVVPTRTVNLVSQTKAGRVNIDAGNNLRRAGTITDIALEGQNVFSGATQALNMVDIGIPDFTSWLIKLYFVGWSTDSVAADFQSSFEILVDIDKPGSNPITINYQNPTYHWNPDSIVVAASTRNDFLQFDLTSITGPTASGDKGDWVITGTAQQRFQRA